MLNKELLTGIFQNILPASYDDSLTYLEQLQELQSVVNQLVDVVNGIVESGGSGYILPTATETVKGGVKIGKGVNVDSEGTISVDIPEIPDIPEVTPYELPIASSTQLGGIKVGNNLTIEADGTLNAQAGGGGGTGGDYVLPIASDTVLGGIKINSFVEPFLVNDDGSLSLTAHRGFVREEIPETGHLKLQVAIANDNGGFGGISGGGNGYTINTDGKFELKLGEGLYFDSEGRLCASGGGTTTVGINDSANNVITPSSTQSNNENLNVTDNPNYEIY